MFQHVILFRWNEDSTAEEHEAARQALAGLPEVIEQIKSFRPFPDAGLRSSSWDFGLVAEFDDQQGWSDYIAHPAHVAAVEKYLSPIIAERATVQFEY